MFQIENKINPPIPRLQDSSYFTAEKFLLFIHSDKYIKLNYEALPKKDYVVKITILFCTVHVLFCVCA